MRFAGIQSWNEHVSENEVYHNEYNLVDLQTYYITYLIGLPSLAFLLGGLKGRYFATFYSKNSRLAKRLLLLAHCMVFPSIFCDWDDDTAKHWSKIQSCHPRHKQTLETYAKRSVQNGQTRQRDNRRAAR